MPLSNNMALIRYQLSRHSTPRWPTNGGFSARLRSTYSTSWVILFDKLVVHTTRKTREHGRMQHGIAEPGGYTTDGHHERNGAGSEGQFGDLSTVLLPQCAGTAPRSRGTRLPLSGTARARAPASSRTNGEMQAGCEAGADREGPRGGNRTEAQHHEQGNRKSSQRAGVHHHPACRWTAWPCQARRTRAAPCAPSPGSRMPAGRM